MTLKHRLSALVLAGILTLTGAPVAGAVAYPDAQNTWAAEVIQKAGDYGLMNGRPDGTFGVGVNMTRAEFATVLCRMFGWTPEEPPAAGAFADVNGHWAQGHIYAAASHGATDPEASFRPDDYISRAEMARMIVRALGYGRLAQSLEGADLPFVDVTADRGYIAIAYDLGIINGVEENGVLKFLPTFSAPREQCAAMLVRCYERYTAKTDWLHGFYATSSYSQIDLADGLDGLSVGWAQLQYVDGALAVNTTSAGGNGWVKPEGAELVTGRMAEGGIPCNLCVYSSATTFANLLTAGQQTEAVNRLAAAAGDYSGLTIDFEGLGESQREDFTTFMTALRSALPQDKTLYVCVQPDTWFGGFDYRALGELCDKVILMAHDYQWASIPDYYVGTDHTYCPVTPFSQVYTALKHVTDPQTGVQDRSKLALAISFNTTGFHVDENGLLLDTTFYHPATATIAKRLGQSDTVRVWDEASHNPYLLYTSEEGEHYKLWYEDAQSVGDKLQLARMFGVTGVSVWRLGIVPTEPTLPHYDVWSTLSQR